jgi:hypothetical protein
MKAPDTKTILNITLVIAIIVVGKKIGEKLGLFNTKQDQQAAELEQGSTGSTEVVNPQNPALALNPNYYKTIAAEYNKKQISLNKSKLTAADFTKLLSIMPSVYPNLWNLQLDKVVFDIRNSKGLFDDNETALYGKFQQMKSQFMISYVSDLFLKRYNKDMWSYITDFTNSDEQAKIYNIIKNKPLMKF